MVVKRVKLLGIIVITVVAVVGCAYMSIPKDIEVPKMLPKDKTFKILGKVRGESCITGILGIPWGKLSTSKAYDDALAKVGADALIDVTVDWKVHNFILLYQKHCLVISGIAIKVEPIERM